MSAPQALGVPSAAHPVRRALLSLGLAALLWVPAHAADKRPAYPTAPMSDVVDDYGGVRVPDPYRSLEDADAPATAAWVDAENALTRSVLDAVPGRAAMRAQLERLYDYPRASVPEKKDRFYFQTRNSGLQNQAVLYVMDGLGGSPRVLVDPNTLAADGTVALTSYEASEDGTLLAYALSKSGSDRQEIHVLDVVSGQPLGDVITWAKFTGFAWTPNHEGFYYTRFPEIGTVPAGDENYFAAVYYHTIGDPESADRKIYDMPSQKEAFPHGRATRDGHWLVLDTEIGASDESEIRIVDRTKPGDAGTVLFPGYTWAYDFVDEYGGRFYFVTNENAPRRRILSVAYPSGDRKAVEVVAQGADLLTDATVAGGALVTHYLHNASSALTVRRLDAATGAVGAAQTIALPSIGSVGGIAGHPDSPDLFFGFAGFVQAPSVYRYDVAGGRLSEFFKSATTTHPENYETRQVWYPSKDGTKVSMFLVYRKGLKLDGARPTYLTGYGGFNVPVTPGYRPSLFAWLDMGGVFAEPNLRGGSEYGEEWHKAGMLEKKQNVFDDFIAAGEWLVANHYTKPGKLAIQGGSNGGLLVGACEVQRPDLFGAVVCQVPVADMLRYHRFTVGRFWIPEYGSAENAQQFPFLYKYSPLHNVKDGVAYPATLVTTADHDDRVAPGLAKKYAARLQAAQGGAAPILIRIETKAGHGGGKPVSKRIDEEVDILSFLVRQLGLVPAPRS